jgi:hypothetical protein
MEMAKARKDYQWGTRRDMYQCGKFISTFGQTRNRKAHETCAKTAKKRIPNEEKARL